MAACAGPRRFFGMWFREGSAQPGWEIATDGAASKTIPVSKKPIGLMCILRGANQKQDGRPDGGWLGLEVSHPSDKNKNVRWMGHPEVVRAQVEHPATS
jgi:hypothetical protein